MDLRALTNHLEMEAGLFKELIAILQTETENLIHRDYKGLYETIYRKDHTLVQIEVQGGVRLKLMEDAASRLGMEPVTDGVDLSSIIERVGGDEKDALMESQKRLLSLIETVMEINKLNSLVVKGSLENINKTLGFLGNFQPKSIYRSSGTFEGVSIKGSSLNEGV